MSTQELTRQEIEAELEVIQEKLAVVQTKIKSSATAAQISYSEQIEALEKQNDTANAKLKTLNETSEDTLEQFICGVEICLSALRSAVRETAAKFKD